MRDFNRWLALTVRRLSPVLDCYAEILAAAPGSVPAEPGGARYIESPSDRAGLVQLRAALADTGESIARAAEAATGGDG